MSTQPPDFIPDDEMPDFISDEEMASMGEVPPPARSAVTRFLEPLGQFARGLAALPGAAKNAARDIVTGENGGYGGVVNRVSSAFIEPQLEQGRQASEAFSRGDDAEAAGRGAAAALPVLGPAAAGVGEALAEGDVAGALGQAVVGAMPVGRVARAMRPNPATLARFANNRAAARMLDIWRPSQGLKPTAKEIALDVVRGIEGRGKNAGIGIGNLDELTAEATKRSEAAGAEVRGLHGIKDPVDPREVSRQLRDEAAAKETVTPLKTVTEDPELVAALREQADKIDDLASDFGGAVPAGELFRQRAVSNRKYGKSRRKLPGDISPAKAEAANTRSTLVSKLMHDENKWGKGGLGGSKIIDRDNRVWRNAEILFKRAGLRDNRSLQGLKQLLAGRAAGMAAGAIAGTKAFGPLGGVTGALGGVALGEWVRWGSFRAHHYAKIADLLNRGELDKAADLVQRISAAAAVQEGIRERERHRKAQRALQTQAEGVVAP